MMQKTRFETDVLIIGGGSTGTGVFRDCTLRGMNCILVERDDLASGTTGRNHGLLHSGARYAVTDTHSAAECIKENRILKRIAKHCIEDSSGLFITLPEDSLEYQQQFIKACLDADIDAQQLDPAEALALEPSCNPTIIGAVKVPDGTLDPFRLCSANVMDAKRHGGRLFNNTQVTGLIKQQDRVIGAYCTNRSTKEHFEIYAQQVVNAAGIWGQQIAEYADLKITMSPDKGALLIMDHRINRLVINRCRKPTDADILVPGDTISLIGTTSNPINYDQIDNLTITPKEIDLLLEEGTKLAPILAKTRILRAYAGVRPLISVANNGSGRTISRGIVLFDHQQCDGLSGLITITGGKLMTYRLMAEMASNAVARNIGNTKPCLTHRQPLPGSEPLNHREIQKQKKIHSVDLSPPIYQSALYRHGAQAQNFLKTDKESQAIICECEMVTYGEIEYAFDQLDAANLVDLRRRTRLGMGPCQGELCAYRATGLLQQFNKATSNEANCLLIAFLEERWKGIRPIFWCDAVRETEFTYWLYEGLLGASSLPSVSRSNLKDNS